MDLETIPFPNENHLNENFQIPDWEGYLASEKLEFDARLSRKTRYAVALNDFDLLNVLGSGSFGKVILVKHKTSGKLYAIKLLEKKQIVRGKQVTHTLNEKRILESLRFPFALYLECFFQDNSYLYFTLPFIIGGELFSHIHRFGRLDETLARFYASQVLLGLEYLHFMDLIYRDLKPENVLIDVKGFVKISDFGFCKQVKGRTWTLCGTPEYLAPEIILSRGYGKSVDWWSFGVLVYEMCAGYPPFFAKDHLKLYEKIVLGRYKTASHFSTDLVDILHNILQIDLSKRYGNLKNGVADIKLHNWFKHMHWIDLVNYRSEPPYIPSVKDENDLAHFEVVPEDELVIRIHKSDAFAKEFVDF